EHPRDLNDAGDAQPAVAQRLENLGKFLDQLCSRLAMVDGALREAQLPMEKIEQARVAELEPAFAAVELGERDEKFGHVGLLAAEQVGEAHGKKACVGHAATMAGGPTNAHSRVLLPRYRIKAFALSSTASIIAGVSF